VNQNGTNDTGDTAQSGWTVNLYQDGSKIDTTTSGANGGYTFHELLAPASTYRLCEAPPSGVWGQSEPLPSATDNCNGSGELPKGQTFTPSSPGAAVNTGTNFGNVPAIACAQPMTVSDQTGESYTVLLATCKPGQTFILSLTDGTVDNNSSTANPSVSLWVGDETLTPNVPMVEKIVFPFLIQPDGTQPVLALHYDDTFPFAGDTASNTPTMPFCNFDPRDGTELGLRAPYDTSTSGVMPAGATSCLIIQSQSSSTTGDPTKGTYVAYVYSAIDGFRGTGP
jgi:hypothetical protein